MRWSDPFKGVVFYVVFLSVVSFGLTELALRAYFAYRVGPDVLLYGFASGTEPFQDGEDERERELVSRQRQEIRRFLFDMQRRGQLEAPAWYTDATERGYRKYRPNQVRYDYAPESDQRFRVTINGRGFRGRDFTREKEPGVVRVLTLGASSTFGYYNRDQETYPFQLEQMLRSGCPGRRYEVVNLGVPHLVAAQIRALFVAEGLPLDPDVVGFYEGANDARLVTQSAEPRAPWLERLGRGLLFVALLEQLTGWNDPRLSWDEFEASADAVSARFIRAVQHIHSACRQRGIAFVVANQEATSGTLDPARLDAVSYSDEAKRILDVVRSSGRVPSWGSPFLGHVRLMRDLEAWARRGHVPFVDVIGGLDGRRSVLLSHVHLSPEGNRIVAEFLASEILALTCTARSGDTRTNAADPTTETTR